ncbi:MAG: PspC domain-containing protein [Moheibacter sp.]
MDKTISISLGGFSFIVDDQAFMKLKNYLEDIRRSLQGMEGTEDILSDVEIRIAELFKNKMGTREVVNTNDIDHVINIMGRPEEFAGEEEREEASNSYSSYTPSGKVKRKLYRDPNDKVIAGVLSGLAHYFNIEPWITRVLWVVLFFSDAFISFTSLTIMSYIVLWIILPKAETATQKYEMYGQAGDFETIKKNVSQATSEMKGVAKEVSNSIGKVFSVLGMLFLAFIGFNLIVVGIAFIISAIAIIIMPSNQMPVEFFGYLVDYPWQGTLSKILILILVIIPAVLLIIFGARLISSRVKINKTFTLTSLLIWVISIIGTAVLVGNLSRNFTRDIEFADKKSFTIDKDTIALSFNEYKQIGKRKGKWIYNDDFGGFAEFDGKLHRKIYDDIEIRKSPNDQVFVETVYSSRGSSLDNARENAEMIVYEYAMNNKGELNFNDYLTLPKGSRFRDQQISIVVYIPENKIIYTKNIDDIKFDNEESNFSNYQDGMNKFFKFDNSKLECLNCPFDEGKDIHIGIDGDSANVKVTEKGVKISNGEKEVILDNKKIKISDGTDSINIDVSSN